MAVAVGYIDYIDLGNCPLHHCTCSVVEVDLLDCPIDLALDYCRDLDFHTYFEEVEVLEELIWLCPRCCLGCGMGLFFEGVSVGDGEGDGIVAAGLGASETEEEADEGAAEN